jgi:chemotaxis protein MotB
VRRRKRSHPSPENHERWLISYADFITLLFAFFVVMFASSQTDKSKAQEVSNSVTAAFDKGGVRAAVHEILGGTVDEKGSGNAMMRGPGGTERDLLTKQDIPTSKVDVTDLLPSTKFLTQALAEEIKEGKVDVRLEPRGLVVSLRQAAYFPSGGDDIAASAAQSLSKIADTIRPLPNSVRLEGHTDAVPIHNNRFRSNWELSAARSIAMLELFTSQYGIPRDRFAIAGYADTVPVASNDTEEGRTRNRRVDIVILKQNIAINSEEPVRALGAAKAAVIPK